MTGWIKAHRQMRSSPMLSTAVRKGVWLDLLLMAAYQPTRTSLRGRSIELQPGECAVVIADWAKSLGLTSRQIERIVDSFVSENAVSKRSAAGKAFTIITICNYAKYQHEPLPRGESAVEGTGKARWKDGGSEQEVEESKELESCASADAASVNGNGHATADLKRQFNERFWPQYPRKKGKDAALSKFLSKAKVDGVEAIMAGLEAANAEWDRKGTETDFIPYPSTWLNQGRFKDEPDQRRARSPASPASYPGEW